MTVQIAQKGNAKLITGTTSEILDAIVSLGYPTPRGITYDTSQSKLVVLTYQ